MPVYTSPINIHCLINNHCIPFELDTGAAVSTLSDKYVSSLNLSLTKSNKFIIAYGNNSVQLLGEVTLPVSFDGVTVTHTFYVVSNTSVNLLGRDLLNAFNFSVVHNPSKVSVNNVNILEEFGDYLSSDFQSNVTDKVKLNVPSDAIPIY